MTKNKPYAFPVRFLFLLVFLSALTGALLSCGSNDERLAITGGVVTIHRDLSDIPEGVDHLHYIGYDESGNRVYDSPPQVLSSRHTLMNVPPAVVWLVAEFHTSYHEEINANAYPVSFGSTGTATIAAGYRCTQFDPARLALVDTHTNGNLLVRGNLPMITNDASNTCLPILDRTFAYAPIDEKMKTLIGGFNLDDYEIIDVTLIDNQSDRNQFTAEMNTFGLASIPCGGEWPPYNNSCAWDPEQIFQSTLSAGQHPWGLIWWPIYACGSTPCNDTDTQIGLENFKFNDLSGHLGTLLSDPPSEASGKSKRLVYFHCMQGADRTGALHAVYLLDADPSLTLPLAFDQASKGYQRGEDTQQINPAILPSCTYAGLAQKYCLTKHPGDTVKCALPVCKAH